MKKISLITVLILIIICNILFTSCSSKNTESKIKNKIVKLSSATNDLASKISLASKKIEKYRIENMKNRKMIGLEITEIYKESIELLSNLKYTMKKKKDSSDIDMIHIIVSNMSDKLKKIEKSLKTLNILK